MKFSSSCEAFQKALSFAARGTALRTTLPILSNVLVQARQDGVHLRATDLVIDLMVSFEAEVEDVGEVVIPANQLLGFLSAHSGDVQVHTKKMMMVRAGNGKIRLNTMPPAEFPGRQELTALTSFEIDKGVLKDIFDRVGFAVAREVSRPILTGTYFDGYHELMVGADGRRMAIFALDKLSGQFSASVSQRGIEEARRITDLSEEDTIKVDVGERFSSFSSGDYQVIVTHIAGQYPANAVGLAERLKQRDHPVEIRMGKESLLKALEIAALFDTGLITAPLRLTCDKQINVKIESDAGTYEDNIEGEIIKGSISLLLSPSQVIEAVRRVKADDVIFLMGAPHQPIIILDPEDENWMVVQVPIADKAGVEKWEQEKTKEETKEDDF